LFNDPGFGLGGVIVLEPAVGIGDFGAVVVIDDISGGGDGVNDGICHGGGEEGWEHGDGKGDGNFHAGRWRGMQLAMMVVCMRRECIRNVGGGPVLTN